MSLYFCLLRVFFKVLLLCRCCFARVAWRFVFCCFLFCCQSADESLVRCCGKFAMLDVLLPALKAAQHRVLVFSQMTKLLDLLEVGVLFCKEFPCAFPSLLGLLAACISRWTSGTQGRVYIHPKVPFGIDGEAWLFVSGWC